MARMRALCSGLPATMTGPLSLPLSSAARESRRRLARCFSRPWHPKQCPARTGRTRASKNSTAAALPGTAGLDAAWGGPANPVVARASRAAAPQAATILTWLRDMLALGKLESDSLPHQGSGGGADLHAQGCLGVIAGRDGFLTG